MPSFFETLYNEFIGFLGISNAYNILKSGDYQQFLTYDGITSLINPLVPLLLILELTLSFAYKKPHTKVYKVNFIIYIFNRFIGRYISIGMVTFCIGLFSKYAILNATITWYWLIYGYIIWEFSHFIYHFLAHKVRLFWCLHATHHAPENMNLSVTYAHFFLEAPYADVIRTSICILLGVSPTLLFLIMFIDGTYGALIHVGENLMRNARLGFLEKYILTPSHHRVHHAKNPIYIDTNFCNLLNIWDRIFGTYQEEDPANEIEYGITREINTNSFIDVYFGEFILLFKDVWQTPGFRNKLFYIIMPPGWNHSGEHKTATKVRSEYFEKQKSL